MFFLSLGFRSSCVVEGDFYYGSVVWRVFGDRFFFSSGVFSFVWFGDSKGLLCFYGMSFWRGSFLEGEVVFIGVGYLGLI